MTLRSTDLQSDSDLDSIRNSCDVLSGKQAIPIDEYTFPHFIPRLGFLLDDLDMDEGLLGVMMVMVVLMSRMILVVTMCMMMLSVKPTQHSYNLSFQRN